MIDKLPEGLRCDSGCGKPAKYWFGNTSVATCGSYDCSKLQEDRYEAHCEEMERQWEFEREMQKQWSYEE